MKMTFGLQPVSCSEALTQSVSLVFSEDTLHSTMPHQSNVKIQAYILKIAAAFEDVIHSLSLNIQEHTAGSGTRQVPTHACQYFSRLHTAHSHLHYL